MTGMTPIAFIARYSRHEFGNVGQLNDRAVERLEPEAEQSIGQGLCADGPAPGMSSGDRHESPRSCPDGSRRASHHLRDGDALPHASLTVTAVRPRQAMERNPPAFAASLAPRRRYRAD